MLKEQELKSCLSHYYQSRREKNASFQTLKTELHIDTVSLKGAHSKAYFNKSYCKAFPINLRAHTAEQA